MEGNSRKTEASLWLGMVVCDREGGGRIVGACGGSIRVEEELSACNHRTIPDRN